LKKIDSDETIMSHHLQVKFKMAHDSLITIKKQIITMRMPSTYISLLLFCGLMLLFIYCRSNKPAGAHSNMAKMQPARHLIQNKKSESGFSFFRDVISNIAPALKNAK
jgi:hypothetical protein